jgi:hypothetical protein
MYKLIGFLFVILSSFYVRADFSVNLCIDYAQGSVCYSDVDIGQDGSVDLGTQANSYSGNTSATHLAVQNQVQQAITGVQLQRESFSSAQQEIAQRIATTMNISIDDINVDFNTLSSKNSPFVKQQLNSMRNFEAQLFQDVFKPTVRSEYFSAPIQFDAQESGDNKALKAYHRAKTIKHQQLGQNDAYRESDYSVKMIEMRQYHKDKLPAALLANFTELAKGMLDNNADAVLSAYQAFMASQEFQTGFASSVANNVNPASFVFPVEIVCDTDWCKAGEYAGDITSTLIGGYEFLSGMALSVGSSGLTVTLAASGGGAVAVPYTAAGVAAGVAMAGHGLTVVSQSIKNLYSRIQTAKNIANVKHSQSLLAKLDKKQLKQLKKASKKAGIDLKIYSKSHGELPSLALLDDSVQVSLKKWDKNHGGKHKFFDHSFGKKKDRLASLEKRAGFNAGELSQVHSENTNQVVNSLNKLTELAESVIKNPQALTKQVGDKKVFWVEGKAKSKNGIRVMTYKDKITTVMPTPRNSWDKF